MINSAFKNLSIGIFCAIDGNISFMNEKRKEENRELQNEKKNVTKSNSINVSSCQA